METFLNETVGYYTINPNRRCVSGMGCFYNPEAIGKGNISEGCAIGRHMTKKQQNLADNMGAVGDLEKSLLNTIPAIKGFPLGFLEAIQSLHDGESNWTKAGLSVKGRKTINDIQTEWLTA